MSAVAREMSSFWFATNTKNCQDFHYTKGIGMSDYVPDHLDAAVRRQVAQADWQRLVSWHCRTCDWEGEQGATSRKCPQCGRILTREDPK